MKTILFFILILFMFGLSIDARDLRMTDIVCQFDGDCGHGQCRLFNSTTGYCRCDHNYIVWADHEGDGPGCNYQQVSKADTFMWSFFFGLFGGDWFVLARGSARYFVAGVFKCLTLGGFGIWWLIDWARVLAGQFRDGHGNHIGDWT